jgi:tetratricopeptide (TPR) repeat protein
MPAKRAETAIPRPEPEPVRGREAWLWAGAAALAAAAVAAYGRTLSVPFLFDDDTSIAANATIRHLGTAIWPASGATVSGRPVLNLSLAANYAVSGTSVWSYHALNLAIHVLAGWTLFGIVRRTLEPRRLPHAASVAFCSSLLWTLHPLQTESVTYVIQRAESLMGLFYLLTLYCFIRGAGADTAPRRSWYILSGAACLLGMGTKEVMVTAPIVVLLYDRTFVAGSLREALRLRRGLYAGLASTWVLLLVLVVSTQGRAGTAGFGSGVPWWGYALTQLPALAHYLRLSLWPDPLVFDYGSALAVTVPQFAPGAVMIAGLLAATAWAMARRPALGFLGFCFFAVLAPSSSIVPVATETMAEHRMYLPLIPVVVLAVLVIHRSLGRWALPLCLALAAALSWATWQRNGAYRSSEAIWADTVSKRPGNERAQNNLGFLLSRTPGRMDEAIAHYEEALRLKPDYAQAHDNLASALVTKPGRLEDAVAHFEEALRLKPDLTEAHYNLGCALEKIPGRAGEAIAHYEEALRQDPDYAEAHYNLGCLLQKAPGRLDDAIAQYAEALRVKPGLPEAHYNLGRALEAKPGRLNEAIAHYEEALRLKPDYAEAHNSLGDALQESPGRMPEAIRQYEEAVRLKPGFARAHFNLGYALETAGGRKDEAVAHYEQALRLEPGFAQAHYNLACVLQRLPGRMDEAIGHYQEALRLRPDYAEAHCNLGNALDAVGRTREAEAQYAAALQLLPDNATIHLDLALVLLKTPGRTADAVFHLREAIRLEPGNEPARRILSQIAPTAQ